MTQKPRTEYDSETREKRYVIIDAESGEIVDDAQGYGYKMAQKAFDGWSYKNRDKSKDKEKAEKERIIARWMRENKKFVRLLDRVAFEIQVGKWGHEDKVDAKLVKDLLEENGYTDLLFSSGDLLRYWDKGPVYSRKKRK